MAGLRLVLTLEGHEKGVSSKSNNNTIINKATTILMNNVMMMNKPQATAIATATTAENFLDCCFLCRRELLLGKDVYMYKGDRGFCSTECRSKQILMDDEKNRTVMLRRRRRQLFTGSACNDKYRNADEYKYLNTS
ncbi:uncharacterized protein LOC141642347 [Silene latifolia]|uniref:uncharacterized protein LOC141642347 n=1 Tax=Silene latifolia TaxID=37657 RepID=UPI003D78A80F